MIQKIPNFVNPKTQKCNFEEIDTPGNNKLPID